MIRTIILMLVLLLAASPLAVAAKPKAVPLPEPPKLSLAAALPLIDSATADGRLDAARDLLAQALAGSDSPELALRGAEIALAGGELDAAATGFTTLLADTAVGARAQQGLGIVRLRQNRLPDAIAALDAALAADPTLLRAVLARGVVADRQQDWPRADAAWAQAFTLAPQSAAAHNNRGWSLLRRGRHAEAEADFAAALALDPRLAAARTNLIFTRALMGQYKEAFAASDKATLAQDLNTVGYGAMARGDTAVAQTYFERAMQKNPRFDRTAWANLQYLLETTAKDPGTLASAAAQPLGAPATQPKP